MREVEPRLWIGNARDARDVPGVLSAGIEAIIDLAMEEPPVTVTRGLIYCRIPLSDGSGNSSARLQLAVDTTERLIASATPTLVACSAGMSRSPAVVAAALSRLNAVSLQQALDQVTRAGPADVSSTLLTDIAATLA